MIREKRRSWLSVWAVFVPVLAFCLFLAYATPYSPVDDLQWGMEEGLRWWLQGLLNGRYVGNFFAVVMCRFPPVKTVLMGLGMFALPLLAALVAARGNRGQMLPGAVFAWAGLLLMPSQVWKETFCWVCGFGNYVISILFFLFWLLLIRRCGQSEGHAALWGAGLFLTALACGLFLENLTLLNLLLALLLLIRALALRRGRGPALACLLGAGAAVVPMFCNHILAGMLSTGSALNDLRQFTFSLEDGLISAAASVARTYFGELLPLGLSYGPWYLSLPLAALTACALWRSPLRPLALLGAVPLACGWWVYVGEGPLPPWAAGCLCWFLPMAALPAMGVPWGEKGRILLLYLAAPASLVPMAAITARGGRLFLFPLVMLLSAALACAGPLLERRGALPLAAAGAVALMAMWGARYVTVLSCTNLRNELIAQAVETDTSPLVLPTDRYAQVVWWSRNPWDVECADWFRRFYHIPDHITLVFLSPGSYESWPDLSQEQWEGCIWLEPSKDFTPSLP